jgi:hypothetical protein
VIRVSAVQREVQTRFPSVFAPFPEDAGSAPAVANVLETYVLSDGDDVRALVGIESWVTRTAWLSCGGVASLGSNADSTEVSDFALGELGISALLGFTSDDAEKARVETELRGRVIGDLASIGRPTTIFKFEGK